ncbi:MAG: M56 family metallopeptidase [Christensenellaceae bacterium]
MHWIINELNKLSFVIAPIFYKLLFVSITGALVGGVILMIRRFFDKKIPPFWKYLMWAVVVLALLLPFRLESNITLTDNIRGIEDVSFREEYDSVRYEAFLYGQNENSDISKTKQLKSEMNLLFYKSLIFDVAIPLAWFFGMLFAFLFFIWNKIYLSYKIKTTVIKNNQFDEILKKCKNRLGIKGNVAIVVQDYIKAPALFGLLKPKILLPIYAESISEESLYYILLHELSHYKRKDMLVNYILLLVQAVHWFNPLVWLLFKFIREDMELLNDSYVLKAVGNEQSRGYAKSLVEVLGLSHNVSLMPKLLCMVDGKKNVERRISMIKLGETFKKHKMIVAVCCLAVICVVSGLFLTQNAISKEKTIKNLVIGKGENSNYSIELVLAEGKYFTDKEVAVGGGIYSQNYSGSYLLKLYRKNTLLSSLDVGGHNFGEKFEIEFSDYNEDGEMDFTIGQWGGSNYNEFTVYSVDSSGKLYSLGTITTSEGKGREDFSKVFRHRDKTITTEYYNMETGGIDTIHYIYNTELTMFTQALTQESTPLKAITFPAYTVENPDKLLIIDLINNTKKFKVVGDFPESWEYRTVSNGETVPTGEFYTPVYIYEKDKLIGYIGFNIFEPYKDEIAPEQYYKSVYSGLRLSRFFLWDPYTTIIRDEISETGVAEIHYLDETEIEKHPGALASVPELESNGILSYDKDKKVYIGIAFMPNVMEREQLESIARTITIRDNS